ncbi:TetR/AcrR family transcriptional regulator [Shewanella olleyana]|uniref:TetR/AcrR family transcriptional regulator n=1 Tax=Shewanella olleyana TaxID=135626 RepID=UPI00200F1B04|nr:TetR/AcrR family transcriptional regulator [Shewanella olleyana]MCL1066332.1 TetR/AcrR family transcriptional regulator [Shewanella olleyana]
MSVPDLRPKQKRSQETHDKFLESLQNALQVKYFEHISIKELAEGAGVSVGTFYRRFENKEALLPLLYDAFGKELGEWIEEMEALECSSLEEQVTILCESTHMFLDARKSVFRTIHLNARLHSDTIFANPTLDRNEAYSRLSNLLLKFTHKSSQKSDSMKQHAADMVIYMMINGLLDKILYPNLTPAIACSMSQASFVEQLPKMLVNYLKPCFSEL